MNRLRNPLLLSILVSLICPSSAFAASESASQVIIIPKAGKTRIVTHTHRRPRPKRIRLARHTHVVTPRSAVQQRATSVNDREPVISLGLRAVGAAVDISDASRDTINPPVFAGGGVLARVNLTPQWKLEFGVDALTKSTSRDTQILVPMSVGSSFHFLPGGPIRPYVVGGLVAEMSHIRPDGSRLALSTVDIAAQGGAGAEFFITPQLSLTADLRAQGRLGTVSRELSIAQTCSPAQPCSNAELPQDNRRHDMAVRFGAGVNFHF